MKGRPILILRIMALCTLLLILAACESTPADTPVPPTPPPASTVSPAAMATPTNPPATRSMLAPTATTVPPSTLTPTNTVIAQVTPIPTPTAVPPEDPLSLYDDDGNGMITCAEAKKHGIAPVSREHAAYPFMRDSDGDGMVCEDTEREPTWTPEPTSTPEPTAVPLSETDQAAMWVQLSQGEHGWMDVEVDVAFDLDDYVMTLFLDGEDCYQGSRMYADEAWYDMSCGVLEVPHASIQRVSAQTSEGDLRCERNVASTATETLFACEFR